MVGGIWHAWQGDVHGRRGVHSGWQVHGRMGACMARECA